MIRRQISGVEREIYKKRIVIDKIIRQKIVIHKHVSEVLKCPPS